MTTVRTADLPVETADPKFITEAQAATSLDGNLDNVKAHKFDGSDQTFYDRGDVAAAREDAKPADEVVEPESTGDHAAS